MTLRHVWTVVLLVGLTGEVWAANITGIALFPPDVNLTTRADDQRFLIVATRDDGVTLDVTQAAAVKLADARFARLEGRTLFPVADGVTALEVEYQGHKASAPVTVKNATADRPVSFRLDVMPVLMRAGCNVGSCHGAARGKDGFRLSLFGFDPQADYHRLTREEAARRLNLAFPETSLLIEKAIGAVPHTGGKRFEKDSSYCQTLLRWLEAGAPPDPAEPPRVSELEFYPPAAVLEGSRYYAAVHRPRQVHRRYGSRRDQPDRVPVEQRQLGCGER